EIDGMDVNSGLGAGNNTSVYFDDGAFQELTFETIGGSAESQLSGVVVNMIPKDGGNQFRGSGVATYSNGSLYTSNYSDELKAKGLLLPSEMKRLWDYDAGAGGPLRRNQLWLFASYRAWGSDKTVPLTFAQPGVAESGQYSYKNKLESYLVRLTDQVNQKNK